MDYTIKVSVWILIAAIFVALIPMCTAGEFEITGYIQKINNIDRQLAVLQNEANNIKVKLNSDIEQINKLKESPSILSDIYLNLKLRASRSLALELERIEKQLTLLEDVKRDFGVRLLNALNQKEDGILRELPRTPDIRQSQEKFADHKQIRDLKRTYAQEKVIPPPVRYQYDFSVKDGLNLSEIREKQKLIRGVIDETQREIAYFAVIKKDYLTELNRINSFLSFAQTVKQEPETRIKVIDEKYLMSLEEQKRIINGKIQALNLKTRELNLELANLKIQQGHISNYAMILERRLKAGAAD